MELKRLFTEHPDAVGESYTEHMHLALSFAGPLLVAGLAHRHAVAQRRAVAAHVIELPLVRADHDGAGLDRAREADDLARLGEGRSADADSDGESDASEHDGKTPY